MVALPATWRSGYAAACKAVYTGSIPVVASHETPANAGSAVPGLPTRVRKVPRRYRRVAARTLSPLALQMAMGHAHYSTTETHLHHSPAIEDAAKLTAAFGGEAELPEAVRPQEACLNGSSTISDS